MTKIKRLVAVALAVLMILGNLSLIASAWDATVDGGFNLGIDTKIFRSVDGEWVETTKVEQGETVKARVYLSTDYYTNSGNLLFFYNNSFFTDNFSSGNNTLVVNPYYKSSPYLATGVFVGGPQSTSGVEKAMVNRNAITQEFADAHEFVYISYYFDGTSYNQKFNGSKWFCEFDLTVRTDASTSDEGAFFAVEATTTTPDFTRGIIDVPKGEYNTKNAATVSMTDWEATLNYTNTPVTLFANKVEVNFDANGGSFKSGVPSLYFEGEAGDALAVEDPVRPNYEFKGWIVKDSETNPADVTAYPDGDTEYVAVWEYMLSTDEAVNFETRFYRLDAETGEWIYTEKAKRGEALKARIFVNTSYFTNAGDLIVFYNNQFFTDTYPTGVQQELVVNEETGSAVANGISGNFSKQIPDSMEIANLEEHGYITPEFAASHNAFTIEYTFDPSTGKKLTVNDWSNESDEWLFEFDLQVSANATGKDYFWIEQNTIMNPNDGIYAFINVPFSTDGGLNTEVIGLHSVDVESTVKNNFVELESTITLDADGGVFAENNAEEYVIHDYIGTKVVAPQNPTKEGYTFMGWIDEEGNAAEIPAEQPYDDITLTAVWQAEVDISYDIDGDGTADVTETVTSGEEFVKPEDPTQEGSRFVGWSEDPTGATITGLPDVYPDTDTTYTAIFDPLSYEVNYYVRDPQTLEYKLVSEVPIPYGSLISHVPSTAYKAPEGYTLSEAYSNASLTILLPDDATMPANEVDVYFKLVPNTYTATFDANGGAWADGETTKDVEAEYNTKIVAPEDPTREGYNFICWDPDVTIMDAENRTFVATWEEATYNAVYKVDGNVYESFPTEYNAVIDVPAPPYKEGYTFIGWTDYTEGMTMPAKDVEFIAVFEINEYDAIFDAGEGHFGTVETPEVDDEGNVVTEKTVPTNYGEEIAAPADPVREGYTFSGWEPVVPDSMPDEDTTFTATWSPNTDTPYIVEIYTMDTEGVYGTPVVQNKTGTTGTTAEVTPNAAEGMYVDEETEKTPEASVLKAEILPDGSTVLKIYYAREEVTVTFDANDGVLASTDGEGNAIEVEELVYDLYYGATVAAPADPTLTGYTFKGWEPAVVNKAIEDATYVAQWTVNQYTISFDTDGGSTIDPITDDFGADITVPENPTKEGYTFVEWVDENDEPADVPTVMPAEDTALKATWEINKYDISLDAEGGKLADGNETYAAADVEYATDLATYGVPMAEPTKTGYTFLGWSETEGSTTAEIAEIPATMPADDIIYYAVWEINEYTITFDTDGGSTIDPITDDYDAAITVPNDPTKEGHTFAGWVDEDNNPADVPTTMPAEDTNLKATWTVNSYKLNYVDREADVAGYPTDVKYGEAIPVPATPNNPGFVFLGWYDASGKQPSDYGVMPAGDLEFTAKWNGISGVEYLFEVYEMKVDGTYPETATSTTTLTGQVGETVTVSSYTAPEGFTIEESELTGTIEEGTQLVLYVKAKRNSYVLKAYDGQEADAAELVNKAYLYGAPIDKVADPTRDGYEFAGWVDSADEAAAAAATIPVNMPAENVTVYATWTKGTFDATFDAGEGAEFPNGEQTVTDPVELDDPIEAPADEPKKDGYDFIGWAPADDPDNVITDGNYGNMDADGEDFVAVWEKSTYKVTFYDYVPTTGGYITPTVTKEIVSAEYDYEEKIVFPSEVDLYGYEHYEFMGWTLADNKPIITDDPALLALLVDTENAIADFSNADENGEINYYAVYKRVKVMLIPKNDTCTTVIDRNGLTVDDYVDGESIWYVYGLQEILLEDTLLDEYIDVQGDGRIEIVYKVMDNGKTFAPFTGTGTTINVYDNVTDELVESFTIIIYGDLNGDSFIQAIDASIAEDETLGITSWSLDYFPDEYVHYMLKAGDIGGADGYITAKDAVIIEDTALTIYVIDQVTGMPE